MLKLTFDRHHASDLAIINKDKLLDSLKALLDKGLHIAGLLGLSQDLQQLIVGQEEEPANPVQQSKFVHLDWFIVSVVKQQASKHVLKQLIICQQEEPAKVYNTRSEAHE